MSTDKRKIPAAVGYRLHRPRRHAQIRLRRYDPLSSNNVLHGSMDDVRVYHEVLTAADITNQYVGIDGADTIRGGTGDDFIFGDAGNDNLWGDDGDDTIDGGLGCDWIDGILEPTC